MPISCRKNVHATETTEGGLMKVTIDRINCVSLSELLGNLSGFF